MATQKTLWLPKIGADFTLGDNSIPEPGPGELLVELKAIALNPIDWKIQKSGFVLVKEYPAIEYPAIVGSDGAGIVQKVGHGVTDLMQGDAVFFQTSFANKYSTFQQYCLTDESLATVIPQNVSYEQAASIATGFNPFAIATYAQQPQGLAFTPPFTEERGIGKYANQPIVIMGGASSVGQYAIQLAKLSGFSPLITTASPHNKELLISLGATHALDRNLSPAALKEQVAQITNTPITYIFDAVSLKETQQTAFSLLAPGGTLAVVTEPQVKGGEENKNVFAVLGSFHIPQNRELGAKFAKELPMWLVRGAIKPNKIEVLPDGLKGIVPGLKRLATEGVSATKLIVRPADTPDD